MYDIIIKNNQEAIMKKLIVISIILILMFTVLIGCAATVESGIQSKWKHYETYIYNVTKAQENVGTMTLISTRITNNSVTIGGKTYDSVTGTKIEYNLAMNNGDSVMAEVFFTTTFKPKYSYKEIVEDASTTIIEAKYDPKKYIYKITEGSQINDGTITLKNITYYDNEMVNHILRSVDMSGKKNFSFTFSVPSPIEDKMQSRTAALIQKIDVPNIMGNTVNCYHVRMNVNQRIAGTPHEFFFAANPYKRTDDQGKELDVEMILVKFIEGEFTYTITAMDIKPFPAD